MLTTLTVNVPYDVVSWVDTDSVVSLREAVERTNAYYPGLDIIQFAASLNGATITLGKDALGNPINTGELWITDSLTIDASTLAGGITIDAGGGEDGDVGNGDGFRIFYISGASVNVTLNGLTLTGGDVSSNDLLGCGGAGLGCSHQRQALVAALPRNSLACPKVRDYTGVGPEAGAFYLLGNTGTSPGMARAQGGRLVAA